MARKLGVRLLNDFVWVSGDAIGDSQRRAPPPKEVVVKGAVRTEPGYLYMLIGNDIWRRTRTQSGAKIATVEFVRENDEDWLYYVDREGNIVRTPKRQSNSRTVRRTSFAG